MFCKEFSSTTKGEDIFKIIDKYFSTWNLSWKQCVGICTDGAPSMVGRIKGFTSFIKTENHTIIFTHCFLHRENLMSKSLGEDLNSVMDDVIKIVNNIKANALKSRMFERLCENLDATHKNLILHTEIRWLSKGKVLARLCELKNELIQFFSNTSVCEYYVQKLKSEIWMSKVHYLNEVFTQLNNLNLSMQTKNENILQSTDKIKGFLQKILYWKNLINEGNSRLFPTIENQKIIETTIVEHLESLERNLTYYFPSININQYDWIRNPFANVDFETDLPQNEGEELAQLSMKRDLQLVYSSCSLEKFWLSAFKEYPTLGQRAIIILLQFSTSYLSELGFSTLVNILSKKRGCLKNIDEEMRVCLSFIPPDIKKLLITNNLKSLINIQSNAESVNSFEIHIRKRKLSYQKNCIYFIKF